MNTSCMDTFIDIHQICMILRENASFKVRENCSIALFIQGWVIMQHISNTNQRILIIIIINSLFQEDDIISKGY